jgi:hypothetical protein
MTKSCFIGFDGFIDHLYQVVKTRQGTKEFTPYSKMEPFANKIVEQKGQSINFELVPKTTKIGGNGPILANCLLNLGHPLTVAGAFGNPIDPVFHPLQHPNCKLFSLAMSGVSEILEFDDGKVILGKLSPLFEITYEKIEEVMEGKVMETLDRADLFVSANWTMLPHMNDIWEKIGKNLHQLKDKKRDLFVDLADPAKREDQDLIQALKLLKSLTTKFTVTLGLNDAEANRIKKILSIDGENIEALRKKSGLCRIVQHNKHKAIGCDKTGVFEQKSDFTSHPKVTTGAGDNFNGGFCHALLKGVDLQKSLLSAVQTSGYYVRHGKSPTQEDLKSWDI